jgi:Ca-activated chloride channel family protein
MKQYIFLLILLGIMFPGFTRPLDDITDEDIGMGNFFFEDMETGEITSSIILSTEVQIDVTGIVLRGRVTQYFKNQSKRWMEGVYMFPLPETAAVDTLLMRIGDRIIKGEIKEKEEAKQVYETAKEEGKKASLLEQFRPNIFQMSAANIGPEETIAVTVEFQQSVDYDKGEYSVRFPMVVGSRYIPLSMFGGFEALMDPEYTIPEEVLNITAPVANDKKNVPVVKLLINLDPGFPVANITSPYLLVTVIEQHANRWNIVPVQDTVAADRDFVLSWKPENPSETYTACFTEEFEGDRYSLIMIQPPQPEKIKGTPYPREVIIILDTSGSMSGQSIKQARRALITALDSLNEADYFNIIEFDSDYTTLFSETVPVSPEKINAAKQFVESLEANSGTEMYPALKYALSQNRDSGRLFQVIFITDGCVGNEAQIFQYIKNNIGDGRLFSIGIGSAPNSYFMRKAAQVGRGTFLHIGSIEEVQDKMEKLFHKLANPVLTDISIVWENSSAEVFPDPVTDLYAGEPLFICTKSYNHPGSLFIRGMAGEKPWDMGISGFSEKENSGIARLWGRRKIEAISDQRLENRNEDQIRQDIIKTALTYHLVSDYTSLVAVEEYISRPVNEEAGKEKVAQAMPGGWDLGILPKGGIESNLFVLLGIVFIIAAFSCLFLFKRKNNA